MRNYIAFLDELRGVAALSVALLHAGQIFGFGQAPHADLAVDFFFCLSGFVLANRYDQRLRSGALKGSSFFLKRVIRLYPMIIAGVALGVTASLIASNPIIPVHDIPILTIGALALLPFGLLVGQQAFAINNPLWSLCFEMVASAVYGLAARRRIRFWHEVVLLVLLAAALFQVINNEGGVGQIGFANWHAFFEGFIRVGFSFFAGVLIFRWKIDARLWRVPPQIPLFALILVLYCPIKTHTVAFDFLCIGFIVPLMVAMAAAVPQNEKRPLARHLGRLSYPLYIVHQPIIRLGAQFQMVTHDVVPLPITVVVTLLAAIGVAQFLSIRFDEPVRASIGRRLQSSS